MGPRGGGGGFGFLHVIGGLISMALFFALLVLLAALAYKLAVKKGWVRKPRQHGRGPFGHRGEPGGPQPHQPHDALRILDERLARGEIEIEDYKARRDALTGNSYPPFQQPPRPEDSAPPAPPAATPAPHAPDAPVTLVDEHPPHVPPQP